jgi:hypothetical protein
MTAISPPTTTTILMKHWLLGLALLVVPACGGRLLEGDDLCTPPDTEEVMCTPVEGHVECPMSDGSTWSHLPSGVWLHLRADKPRVLCDVAPDGRIIARTP